MTYESMDYPEYLKQKKAIDEAKQASVRYWSVVLGHLFLPPVSSLYYAVKTNLWKPFLWASGTAVICIPISVIDAGISLSLIPPATSAAIIITNTQEKRRKLQVFGPEQADQIRYNLEK